MVLAQAHRGGAAGREERMRVQRLQALANQLRPFYRYELMHTRTACNLTREQLRKMRPELDAAYERAIARIDAARGEGSRTEAGEGTDYMAAIREEVLAVVNRHATPEQLSACRDDLRRGEAGRREAAIDMVVATIDRELLLSNRQRKQIAGSLAARVGCPLVRPARAGSRGNPGHPGCPRSASGTAPERKPAGGLASSLEIP